MTGAGPCNARRQSGLTTTLTAALRGNPAAERGWSNAKARLRRARDPTNNEVTYHKLHIWDPTTKLRAVPKWHGVLAGPWVAPLFLRPGTGSVGDRVGEGQHLAAGQHLGSQHFSSPKRVKARRSSGCLRRTRCHKHNSKLSSKFTERPACACALRGDACLWSHPWPTPPC